MRARDLVEIRQFLDLAILTCNSGEVGRPDVSAVASTPIVRNHTLKRTIQRIRVDANHPPTRLDQPEYSLATEPRLRKIVTRVQSPIGPGLDQNDLKRANAMVDPSHGGFKILHGDKF